MDFRQEFEKDMNEKLRKINFDDPDKDKVIDQIMFLAADSAIDKFILTKERIEEFGMSPEDVTKYKSKSISKLFDLILLSEIESKASGEECIGDYLEESEGDVGS